MASNYSHLPEIPRSNLPSWPRGRMKPSIQPSPISKDILQPLPAQSSAGSSPSTSRTTSRASLDHERKTSVPVKLPLLPAVAQQRISQMEREVDFLKLHHSDTLCKLHEEIQRIKKKNKDLMYQLAMGGAGPSPSAVAGGLSRKPPPSSIRQHTPVPHAGYNTTTSGSASTGGGGGMGAGEGARHHVGAGEGSRHYVGAGGSGRVPRLSMDESRRLPILRRSSKVSVDESIRLCYSRGVVEDSGMVSDELRTIMLEEEIKDLKNALHNEKKKNVRLMTVIEQRRPGSIDQSDAESIVSAAHSPVGPGERSLARKKVPVPQYPSVEQYKSIIKHLQKTNDTMAHELLRLKSDLRDVLFAEKFTPESFLIAKAYVKRDGDDDVPGISGLPKFHSGVNHYGQKPDMLRQACRTVNEGTALPPLRPKLQSNVAERKRKTEAIQKSRHSKPHH